MIEVQQSNPEERVEFAAISRVQFAFPKALHGKFRGIPSAGNNQEHGTPAGRWLDEKWMGVERFPVRTTQTLCRGETRDRSLASSAERIGAKRGEDLRVSVVVEGLKNNNYSLLVPGQAKEVHRKNEQKGDAEKKHGKNRRKIWTALGRR